MNLQDVVAALKRVATFAPEYNERTVLAEIKEPYESLIKSYSQLKNYPVYLDFLKMTGGAHIHNHEFSLGIYGFRGQIVTSFDEGLFLDQDRYFHFGEVLYSIPADLVFVFAFDLRSAVDNVYISPIEESNYSLCCGSFSELLNRFANGAYPGLPK
jgi:hypothetical protein